MTGLLFRLLPIGLAALLMAAPLAVEPPADVPDEPSESSAPASGPLGAPDGRLSAADARVIRGSFDSTASTRILSRPPPCGALR